MAPERGPERGRAPESADGDGALAAGPAFWNTMSTAVSGGGSGGRASGRPISSAQASSTCSASEAKAPRRIAGLMPEGETSMAVQPGFDRPAGTRERGCRRGLRARRLLGQQGDLGESALGDGAHHLHDPPVGEVLVAAHEDAPVWIALRDRLQLRHQLAEIDLLVLQVDLALGVDTHAERLAVRVERLGVGLRQIDADPGRHQRRGDHEDDQQHQHHVHQRRDVDLGERAVAPARPGAPAMARAAMLRPSPRSGATGWR